MLGTDVSVTFNGRLISNESKEMSKVWKVDE